MKKGLILEGGALRGIFSVGVMDVLMENGIVFDGAIGVSAGALFGMNYKSHQKGRALRYNKRFCNDKRYASFRNLLFTGDLFGVDFCYNKLPYELDIFDFETYKNDPMEFYAVATDAKTGGPVYRKCPDMENENLQWCRASGSMPIFSRPVPINGGLYLDGGVADSIPVRFFESIGYDRNVVILTRPEGYRKGPNKAMPLANIILKKYPKLIKAMSERHLRYNETLADIARKEKTGELFVIRPSEAIDVKPAEKDPEKLQAAYDLGRETAEKLLPELVKFLNK